MDVIPSFLHTYWPALVVIAGFGFLIYGFLETKNVIGILGFLLYGGLGTVFLCIPPGGRSTFFQEYWPGLFFMAGIACLVFGVFGDHPVMGIVGLLFWSGIGVLLLLKPPAEIWAWSSQFELIDFFCRGPWYEIVLKVTGAIGAMALALKLVVLILEDFENS